MLSGLGDGLLTERGRAEVIYLEPEEIEPFRERVEGIHEDFRSTRVGDLADRIREAASP